jgi:transcriptional regulator with XRE-family HTH domain
VKVVSDMAKDGPTPSPEDQAIGQRLRRVRGQRDMSLDVAAGLAGMSKSSLSQLETGKKGFTRRGLIDALASSALSGSSGWAVAVREPRSETAVIGFPSRLESVDTAGNDQVYVVKLGIDEGEVVEVGVTLRVPRPHDSGDHRADEEHHQHHPGQQGDGRGMVASVMVTPGDSR